MRGPAAGPLSQRPNILWLCTDQQRYDTIGALGNPYVSTPNIDRLVQEGMAFERAYCQSPICTPSRVSFLTGMYASAIHVNGNGAEAMPAGHPPLVTKLLANAGYDCGLIGKLHLSSAWGRTEVRTDDGYRYWEYSHAPRDDWPIGHGYADWVRSKGAILGDLIKDPEGVPAELHQTTWCAEKTMEFIGQERSGPWAASVNMYYPHPYFNPPKTYRDQFEPSDMPAPLFRESDLLQQEKLAGVDFQSLGRRPEKLDMESPVLPKPPELDVWPVDSIAVRRDAQTLKAAYYAMIKLVDDQVGRILNYLIETRQRENTLVVFTSDHGEMLGDHGLIQKGCRFYEGLVRVPLIFSWPGHVQEGVCSNALVELTDKAPTFLDLAGAGIPEPMHGRSLAPLLKGENSSDYHRDFVRCEYYDALEEPDHSFATMFRDERHKLVLYHGHGLGELYDLEEDPNEFENMWDEPEAQPLKLELMQRSFDESVLHMDRGPRRLGML